jgi:hypothetical protein
MRDTLMERLFKRKKVKINSMHMQVQYLQKEIEFVF